MQAKREKKLTKITSIALSPTMSATLTRIAEEQGTTVSSLIRMAISFYLVNATNQKIALISNEIMQNTDPQSHK